MGGETRSSNCSARLAAATPNSVLLRPFQPHRAEVARPRTVLTTWRSGADMGKSSARAQRRALLGAEEERRLRAVVDDMVNKVLHGGQGFEAVATTLWEQAGAPDLAIAADAGLLTLSTDAFDIGAETAVQMDQYAVTLRRLLEDPSSHLMFDEQIAGLVAAMIREQQAEMHPMTAAHALRAATGTGLIDQLPAFPDSPMETILATRAELSGPLIRHRKVVKNLAAQLTSCSTQRCGARFTTCGMTRFSPPSSPSALICP